ncbi:MAG: metal ABC transporter substrate-binding protein, partial [Acidimicrobiia bacterium]
MGLKMSRVVTSILVACLLLSCGNRADEDTDDRPLVVATTTILGDVVGNVIGDDARIQVLIPMGTDPHEFQASAAQIADLSRADLVVANGLGLEEGLGDVLEAAAGDGVRVFEVGPLLDPIPLTSVAGHDDEGLEGDGGSDPHVWLDPLRMAEAARLIADQLAGIEPDRDWRSRADEYAAQLVATDREVSEELSAVPEERRRLVTNHESLGYFATRYDFEVVGVVIPGGST